MCAVRAQAGLVLQDEGVVGGTRGGRVAAELQTEQAELAVAPGHLDAVPVRIEARRQRKRGVVP